MVSAVTLRATVRRNRSYARVQAVPRAPLRSVLVPRVCSGGEREDGEDGEDDAGGVLLGEDAISLVSRRPHSRPGSRASAISGEIPRERGVRGAYASAFAFRACSPGRRCAGCGRADGPPNPPIDPRVEGERCRAIDARVTEQ